MGTLLYRNKDLKFLMALGSRRVVGGGGGGGVR